MTERWFCWRVRVTFEEGTRLIIPRSDPHQYEQPADQLFSTQTDAIDWRDEEMAEADLDEQAYIRTWVLCRETLEVIR